MIGDDWYWLESSATMGLKNDDYLRFCGLRPAAAYVLHQVYNGTTSDEPWMKCGAPNTRYVAYWRAICSSLEASCATR